MSSQGECEIMDGMVLVKKEDAWMYAWACTKAEEHEDVLYFKILRDTARAYMESDWGRERVKVVHWGN